MRYVWIMLIFIAGGLAGWLLRDAVDVADPEGVAVTRLTAPTTVKAPAGPDLPSLAASGRFAEVVDRLGDDTRQLTGLMARLPPDLALALGEEYSQSRGEAFMVILTMADLHRQRGAYQASLDAVLQAALLVEDEGQDVKLSLALEDLTDDWSRELIAREDFDGVDQMYERITLAMPERAQYFLKLGRLRMRMGDFEQALVPLSHIENHHKWGASARELIAQAEASEIREAPGQERLALQSAGSQFVVEATLDHGRTIHLLVDTGAAMTIIDEGLLSGFGYSLTNRRQEYFATAGGVVRAPVVTIRHLALGNAGISELPVGALPLGINGIDGLLGMNFLRHYEFRIDQGEQVMYLDSHH